MVRSRVGRVAVVVLGLAAALVGPAGAQDADPGPPPPRTPGEVRIPIEARDAALRLGKTATRLAAVETDLVVVQRQEDALRAELGLLEQQLAENRKAAAVLVDRLRARAATVYVRGGSRPLVPAQVDNRLDLVAGESYASAANSVDRSLVDELDRVQATLERDRARREEARDALTRRRDELAVARAQLEALRMEEQLMLDLWGLVPVMGSSQLTAEQIAAWFESTGVRPGLPEGLTIRRLAGLFVEEGALAGVKGDIAFAQSVIETGSFTEYKGYNFSGIGVCDSCTGGYLFDAARDGVRAQMQLLRSYADPTSRAADLPVPLSPVLYGTDPVESARRFDTFFLKGAAPVWNEMGGGNWATDPYYAGKVLRVYARMLAHAKGP